MLATGQTTNQETTDGTQAYQRNVLCWVHSSVLVSCYTPQHSHTRYSFSFSLGIPRLSKSRAYTARRSNCLLHGNCIQNRWTQQSSVFCFRRPVLAQW